jgi:hypothetical protein
MSEFVDAIKSRIAKLFEREALFSFVCIIIATVALFTASGGMDAETWTIACGIFCGLTTGGLTLRRASENKAAAIAAQASAVLPPAPPG